MKRTTVAAVAAVLLLALAGCADGGGSAATESDRSAQRTAVETSTETTEPLVAETPSVDDTDQQFLDYVRSELLPETQIGDASDASLIDAGHRACEQVLSGVAPEDVRVVEGETPAVSGYYMDSLTIRNGAQVTYCPETL